MQELAATFPGQAWERVQPHDAGLDEAKLRQAKAWLDSSASDPPLEPSEGRHPGKDYRVVVVRSGRVAAEWNRGISASALLNIWSATKSVYSCMLGVLIDEGVIASADAFVRDYYPEGFDVPDGFGPKPGRLVTEKDLEITFRQLICNTSGYMKPGEQPGRVFHYQTFGMNILVHALETACGLYDSRSPESSATLRVKIDDHIRRPIGAAWSYYTQNFDLQPSARVDVFGNTLGIASSALDMARLGWLWRNHGAWNGQQLIPKGWMEEATRTAPDIMANCPEEDWRYGHGFWTNDHGMMWPSLPEDSFAASGAGHNHIWVCPSLDLVVVQGPGLFEDQHERDNHVLLRIADACV